MENGVYHGFLIKEVIDIIDEDLDELTRRICRLTNAQGKDE